LAVGSAAEHHAADRIIPCIVRGIRVLETSSHGNFGSTDRDLGDSASKIQNRNQHHETQTDLRERKYCDGSTTSQTSQVLGYLILVNELIEIRLVDSKACRIASFGVFFTQHPKTIWSNRRRLRSMYLSNPSIGTSQHCRTNRKSP
jgi:hypothetical protein